MRFIPWRCRAYPLRSALSLIAIACTAAAAAGPKRSSVSHTAVNSPAPVVWDRPLEILDDAWEAPRSSDGRVATSPAAVVVRGNFRSVQVNVDALGLNTLGDAANEPSIAVDPVNPKRIAIGWRQFDTTTSNFRQAGWAYSDNAGEIWTFPGVLQPGQFRSDPVLAADADGNFYYYSLSTITSVELFKSIDGGVTWTGPVPGFGGDKEWMTIDRSSSIGRGHIYTTWNVQFSCCLPNDFTRSVDGGASFQSPTAIPTSMKWGTLDVGPDGTLYLAGATLNQVGHLFAKSADAKIATASPTFTVTSINLGGQTTGFAPPGVTSPNPVGLLGQVWIATDHSDGATRGNIYVLGSVTPLGDDPLDVHFIRSTDGGTTWSAPKRVNDDSIFTNAFQWFGTMSVAPNGRIDVVWNDTRNTADARLSELFYSFSLNAGETWSTNIPISPVFNSHLGWPDQDKIGDYYHMVSDNAGANLAYAATFNGEQDVYFLRIGDRDCNGNGFLDAADIAQGRSADCNLNGVPDECEADCNGNGVADTCDIDSNFSADCDGNSVPDECGPDFDGDGIVDGCDDDRDGDGVPNNIDQCDFTPLGMIVGSRGRPLSDGNGDCVVNLSDLTRLASFSTRGICLLGPNLRPAAVCTDLYDYNFDLDVDFRDVAGFMNAFGR